jgi:multidrug efflux pump subunit AcrA (membrane-fusion protein)
MKSILLTTPRTRFLAAVLAATAAFLPVNTQAADSSVVIEMKDVATSFPVEATVEAVRQATVAAQIGGRILDIRVDAGQQV